MRRLPSLTALARAALGLLLAAALAGAVLTLCLAGKYTLIGGWPVRRDTAVLDARDIPVRTVLGLRRLEAPTALDLRGSRLSVRQWKKLTAAFPDCDIRWDVPLDGQRFDSRAAAVSVAGFSARDADALEGFSALVSLEVTGREADWAALSALSERYGALRVRWAIPLGGHLFAHTLSTLRLPAGDGNYRELCERLGYFKDLQSVRLAGGNDLTDAEWEKLRSLYPEITFVRMVETIHGLTFPSDREELSLSGYGGFTLAQVEALLPAFPALRLVDLRGCGFTNEELLAFRERHPEIDVRWTFKLCGASVCTTDTEVDLSGHPVADVQEVEDALFYFPYVERVIMCDCGVSDEEMDALDQRHEDIRFVWMVHFGDFFLRTDATTFIATTFPYGYTYLTNDQLWPLQYCRDLIALDLGHMEYSDVSFLRSLRKLQWLILSDTNISDISMLADMPDLYYLEIFLTRVTDISPLLACKNLRHLNIAYTPIRNTDALSEMTQLERLWAPGVSFTYTAFAALSANPTLDFNYYCESATGGTWRTDPAYYEMRDVFGVYYMPG